MNPMRITSVSSKLKERFFQYKTLPRSLPNSERKIIALLLFLNFDTFTPCVAPERQGISQKEIRLGALRVANRKNMNSVAPERLWQKLLWHNALRELQKT
jgi:hypothetical protein